MYDNDWAYKCTEVDMTESMAICFRGFTHLTQTSLFKIEISVLIKKDISILRFMQISLFLNTDISN